VKCSVCVIVSSRVVIVNSVSIGPAESRVQSGSISPFLGLIGILRRIKRLSDVIVPVELLNPV
jgi:hypothetical protein